MAEFCKDCFKLMDPSIEEKNLVMSSDTELCEGCGQVKQVVLSVKEEESKMTIAECQVETQKHIEMVRKYIRFMIDKIEMRGVKHDASKLESPEVELFTQFTPKLSATTYGSDEYNSYLEGLKPALDHHYASNRHHPEHFVNGVNDMTLVDIIEMFCDWKASTHRMNDGNLLKSIDVNTDRFHIEDQLKQIFVNTARMIDEHD